MELADSLRGSHDDEARDASEGKAYLLYIANLKEANGQAARGGDDPS